MDRIIKKENFIHIMFIYIFLWIFHICTFGENSFYKTFGNNIFLVVGEFTACKLMFNAYKKSIGIEKRFWLLMDLSIISYFIGDLIWITVELYTGTSLTSLGMWDAFYFMQYPLSIIAVLYIVYKRKSKFLTFQMVMDIFITVIAVYSIIWFFIIDPIHSEVGIGFFRKVSLLVNPMGDLGVLLSGLFMILLAKDAFPNKVIFLIISGLLLEIFVDLLYCYITFNNIPISLVFLDPFWVMALLLISYSAIVYDEVIENGEKDFLDEMNKIHIN